MIFTIQRKGRLEQEAIDPQDPKDDGGGGGAAKANKPGATPGGKAPAPSPVARKSLYDRSRVDTSLGVLTQRFAELLNQSVDGVLDLNLVAQELSVSKRRVYDVTNVLEGIQLIKKKSKNNIEWLGCQTNLDGKLKALIEEERMLDVLIQSCTRQVHQMCENRHSQRFAYLTYEDVKRIPSLKEQTVIVIKAPAETKLEVPHPEESLQVHLCSTQGPIEVFLCSDDPIPMEVTDSSVANGSHLNASTDGNGSVPVMPYSPFAQVSSKDNAIHTSGNDSISNLPSEQTQHSPPPTVTPVSPMHTSPEDQQSFVALAPPLAFSLDGEEYIISLDEEDKGITDLFSSFDLEQMPLDMPL